MKRARLGLIAAILFFTLINAGSVLAEGLPGTVEGTGTHFEITDSTYLNITLDSSEEINLRLESVPQMIVMIIESADGATSTDVTLSGFVPNTTYYKYEDNYHNLVEMTTDEAGNYTYTQDLSKKHLVFIQTVKSTKFINDGTNGRDCILIGTWDSPTKTCTLATNVNETIQIDSDEITLDGAGYTVTGTGAGYGVHLDERTDVTIKNLNVEAFFNGIQLWSSNNNDLINNTTSSNNTAGIGLLDSHDNSLTNNTTSNNYYGIALNNSNNNTIVNNNFVNNGTQAFFISGTGNIFDLPATGGNYWSDYETVMNFPCSDTDPVDGFCDVPYTNNLGVTDNLPYVTQDGWPEPSEDTTPPVITIEAPVNYGLYEVGVGVTLDFTAEDSGSGLKYVKGELTKTDGSSQEVDSGDLVSDVGVYTLVVTAEDNAGNIATETRQFVVFDPKGGFATGGGWFNPDGEGEDSLSPDGKASFGFVAKYSKKEGPTGNLEFQYQYGEINLKSTEIDWILVNGTIAQFQGTATINGEGNYKFRVQVKDLGEPGAGLDEFDIRVWNDEGIEFKAKSVIEGGNIVIHSKGKK